MKLFTSLYELKINNLMCMRVINLIYSIIFADQIQQYENEIISENNTCV